MATVAFADAVLWRCSTVWRRHGAWYIGRALTVLGRSSGIDGLDIELPAQASPVVRGLLWLGKYESAERYAVARFLPRDVPVVELGGSAGVVACLINRLQSEPGAHVVVEANPLVIPTLERNRQANSCRFKTVNCAIAYAGALASFDVSEGFLASAVRESPDDHTLQVPAMTLAELVAGEGFEAFSLVCDIEGAEADLVTREGATLQKAAALIMEIHPAVLGSEGVTRLSAELTALGFSREWSFGNVSFLLNRSHPWERRPSRGQQGDRWAHARPSL